MRRFMVNGYTAIAHIQSLKSTWIDHSGGMILRIGFFKNSGDSRECSQLDFKILSLVGKS